LSPRKLKYYEEKNAGIGWKEPRSTQHKNIEFVYGRQYESNLRQQENYSRSNIGSRKPPIYESIAEHQIPKHGGLGKQYYY